MVFRGCPLWVKRDDLFTLRADAGAEFGEASAVARQVLSGNKARKLFHYFSDDYPDVSQVVSHGSAQSNMLASLAVLARLKGWQLDFYVDHIPASLLRHPRGNYRVAVEQGANIVLSELPSDVREGFAKESLEKQRLSRDQDVLFIPEGGATAAAEAGVKMLADELILEVEQRAIPNPKLMLPSGTGTTAYFLQKHLPFEVLTCACVGSAEYLQRQFLALDKTNNNSASILPSILSARGNSRQFQFGKLYREFYQIWNELTRETGIIFDLLYDPLGWINMMAYLDDIDLQQIETPPTMIYLHQGGLLGNESMVQRYKRKFDSSHSKNKYGP